MALPRITRFSLSRRCRHCLHGGSMQDALTDQGYWDAVWAFTDEHAAQPAPRLGTGLVQRHFQQVFAAHLGRGRRFLEIGAGGSAWPAWVAARCHAEAW